MGSFSSLICFPDLCSRYRNILMEQEKEDGKGRGGSLAASGREGAWGGSWVWPHFTGKRQVGWQPPGAQDGAAPGFSGLSTEGQAKATTLCSPTCTRD